MNLLSTPNPSAVLERAAALIRTGVPSVLALPSWAAGAPCPDNHILPAGALIHVGTEPAEVPPDSGPLRVYLYQSGDAVQTEPESDELWNVPITVRVEWETGAEGLPGYLQEIQAILCGHFLNATAGQREAFDRWNSAALYVPCGGVRNDAPSVPVDAGGGYAESAFDLTITAGFIA